MSTAKPIELNVRGMTCTNCALGVEKYLKKEHASAVSVDFTSGAVLFELEKEAQLPRIIKGIEKLGYEVQRAETALPLQGWSNIEKLLAFSLVFTVPLLLHMFISWHPLHNPWVQLALAIPVYLVGMYHFGRSAFHSLKAGVANMDVLVTIGATAAFGYSLYGTLTNAGPDFLFYETAASIISLVLLGNVMEHLAVKRTTSAVEALARLQPETARRISMHGDHEHIEQIEARQIVTGDLIQVNQGDRIPADGIITSGTGEADESMISGESVPRYRVEGEPLLGGSLLVSGNLRMKATATGKDSVLGSIIELVRKAQADKPQIQQLADKISAVFVPAVLAVSLLTFVLSLWAFDLGIGPSLIRSVAVLVIACPCAMGLATPTAVVVGIGRASQAGILIKGGRTLELFSQVKRVVFDKTGTLTTGAFRIAGVHPYGMEEADIQQIVVSLEKRSSHPVARSIQAAWAHITPAELAQVTEAPGLGMTGQDAAGHSYQLGSFRIAQGLGGGQHSLYLLKDGALAAGIDLEDELRPGAREAVAFLKEKNIGVVMLSGDKRVICEKVAQELGITEIYAEQLPQEKLSLIEKFSAEMPTAMVGDGVNDAPALARASVGVSLGQATDAARQSAQIILTQGRLGLLPELYQISRHTVLTIRQNLFWAFFYNVISIPLAAVGFLRPILGTLTMALSDVVVVGNSLRLKTKRLR